MNTQSTTEQHRIQCSSEHPRFVTCREEFGHVACISCVWRCKNTHNKNKNIQKQHIIHKHGWHGHVCCAFRTRHSSHTVQTRSTWQSLWVSHEGVWCWCHVACIPPGSTPRAFTLANSLFYLWMVGVGITQHTYYLYLIVHAQATVPKCHHSLSHLNPHVMPIYKSSSQVPHFLFEPIRPHQNAVDTGNGENIVGQALLDNCQLSWRGSGCREWTMWHWYAQERNFWTKSSSLWRKMVACQ